MRVSFTRRDLARPLGIPGLVFTVERMDWSIQGGPAGASVLVSGPANRLGTVMQLLRCGTVISDEAGGAAWWGFVNGIEISLDGVHVMGVSLDDLANRVAVRYRDERISPDVNLGWQFQSSWAQDNQSVLEWGKKEAIYTKVPASPEEAGSLRAALLERQERPALKAVSSQLSPSGVPGASQRGAGRAGVAGEPRAYARLRLRGWWDTLNWVYFAEARGYVGCDGGGAIQSWGNAAATSYLTQSFTVGAAWKAATLWVKLGKAGAPADNVFGGLYSDAGGPNLQLAASAAMAGSNLNGDIVWTRFDFATPYTLVASTTYWILFNRTGALDAVNYYRLSVDDGLSFGVGVLRIYNGAGWVARVPDADLVFQLTGQAVTTDQIKTMADPAGAGQFLKGVFVMDASGVSGRLYRDGRSKAGDEIQALLDQGNASGRALRAWISPDRWLLVRLVPPTPAGGVTSADLLMLASGELRGRGGGKLPASYNPVGKWARLLGVDQLGGDRSAPGCVLVTKAVWENGRLSVGWE